MSINIKEEAIKCAKAINLLKTDPKIKNLKRTDINLVLRDANCYNVQFIAGKIKKAFLVESGSTQKYRNLPYWNFNDNKPIHYSFFMDIYSKMESFLIQPETKKINGKTCTKCNEHKSLNEFNIDRSREDNHHSICRVCRRIQFKEWNANKKIKKQLDFIEEKTAANIDNIDSKLSILQELFLKGVDKETIKKLNLI